MIYEINNPAFNDKSNYIFALFNNDKNVYLLLLRDISSKQNEIKTLMILIEFIMTLFNLIIAC